jgi:hypothetical protein
MPVDGARCIDNETLEMLMASMVAKGVSGAIVATNLAVLHAQKPLRRGEVPSSFHPLEPSLKPLGLHCTFRIAITL